ncbi:MAG: hypothetical protein AB7E70_19405 [Hyphomicrobiaceae bacterium]
MADLTLRTDCSSGSGVAWDGSSWECAALGAAYTAGDGLTLTGSDFDVVLGDGLEIISDTVSITNDCSDGQVLKSASSGTQWNCAADTDTNTTYSAGTNSLTLTSTTFTIASRDFGDITVGSSGTTMTIDNSTVTSAKLNITTTSCSAGQHVSAISAGGVGTCTADAGGISGLTTNTIPKATSSTAIGNSNATDDGTTVCAGCSEAWSTTPTLGAQGTTPALLVRDTDNDVEGGVIPNVASTNRLYVGSTSSSDVYLMRGGTTYLTITSSGLHQVAGSMTLVNNLTVGDAATDTLTANGDLVVDDDTTLSDTLTVIGKTTANGTLEANGTADLLGANTNLGNASTDLTRTFGVFGDVGTLPTISSCNSGTRTGGQWSFTITPGSGTTCTATFATACNNAPTCSVTNGFSSTSVISYISSISPSAIVLGATGTGWSGSQTVHVVCICH